MAARTRTEFTIKRIKGFLQSLARSKRGMAGVIILLVAIVVAVAAPLITPYSPIQSMGLAANLVPPAWERYLPGGSGLGDNMVPVAESALLQSPNALKEFNFTITGSAQATSNTAIVNLNHTFSVVISPEYAILNASQPQLFTSNVSGITPPYKYQWYLSGAPVSGANRSTWLFTPSWPLGQLAYSVYLQITRSGITLATSNTVIVNLNGTFSVAISPAYAILNASQPQLFTSNISNGLGSYAYQWFLNGAPVSGATNATWTFTPPSSGSYSVYLKVNANEGDQSKHFVIQQSAYGPTNSSWSLAIIYQDDELPTNSTLTITITKDFYYPYSGIPGSMNPSGEILPSEMAGVAISPALILRQNWLTFVSSNVASYSTTYFQFGGQPPIPARITFSPNNFTASQQNLYPVGQYLSWQKPSAIAPYQSQGYGIDQLKLLFPRAGSYSYGIQITVNKLTTNADAVIYVNSLNLYLGGSSWGLLGTDAQGRDIFSQLVYGTRISLYVGLVSAVIGTIIGLIVGLVAAYMGGIVDEVLMRFTDALLVLPGLPLMIVLITVLSNGQYNLNIFILVIGFLGWMGFARVVRSQVLSLKERPYIEAAKAVGAGTPYILFRHILPNVVVLIYVTLALSVPGAIVSEAAFSFLGFIDYRQMSWGRMLNASIGRPELWWLIVPPGLAIAVLSLSFILIGYAIDDILNPKLRARR